MVVASRAVVTDVIERLKPLVVLMVGRFAVLSMANSPRDINIVVLRVVAEQFAISPFESGRLGADFDQKVAAMGHVVLPGRSGGLRQRRWRQFPFDQRTLVFFRIAAHRARHAAITRAFD